MPLQRKIRAEKNHLYSHHLAIILVYVLLLFPSNIFLFVHMGRVFWFSFVWGLTFLEIIVTLEKNLQTAFFPLC